MEHLVGIDELSSTLELSARRCQQLEQLGVFVKKERNQYDLLRCAVAYALHLRKHPGDESLLICTTDDLARAIGQSRPSVSSLTRQGIFEALSHGRYDLIQSVARYVEHLKTSRSIGRPPKMGAITCGAATCLNFKARPMTIEPQNTPVESAESKDHEA